MELSISKSHMSNVRIFLKFFFNSIIQSFLTYLLIAGEGVEHRKHRILHQVIKSVLFHSFIDFPKIRKKNRKYTHILIKSNKISNKSTFRQFKTKS